MPHYAGAFVEQRADQAPLAHHRMDDHCHRQQDRRNRQRGLLHRRYTSSTATAVASPPPMQSEATPRVLPLALSAPIRVTIKRAPLAPIGWPSAVAPPWTLIFSCGMPRSRIANIATPAKASLTAHRSTSSTVQPAFFSTFSMAPAGAMVNSDGSRAWAAEATIRATGFSPLASASDWRVSTSAAAPSEMDELVAAVMVPSLAKAGFKVGILSGRPRPGCSSLSTTVSPLRPWITTGTISSTKAPLSIAALARDRLSIE